MQAVLDGRSRWSAPLAARDRGPGLRQPRAAGHARHGAAAAIWRASRDPSIRRHYGEEIRTAALALLGRRGPGAAPAGAPAVRRTRGGRAGSCRAAADALRPRLAAGAPARGAGRGTRSARRHPGRCLNHPALALRSRTRLERMAFAAPSSAAAARRPASRRIRGGGPEGLRPRSTARLGARPAAGARRCAPVRADRAPAASARSRRSPPRRDRRGARARTPA